MSERRVGSILSLVRQGLTLEVDFGSHTLEALAAVAETVEASVYRPGSLARNSAGFEFVLDNPPLRLGAFSSVRVLVNGDPVAPARVRVRPGEGHPWRSLSEVTAETPLELRPGVPTDFAVDRSLAADTRSLTVRLELTSVAIPPLVWLEFSEALAPGAPP